MPILYKLTIHGYAYYGICSGTFEKRLKRHHDSLVAENHHNIIMQRMYRKHGLPTGEVICETDTWMEACELEKKYIAENDCINIASGGDGGDTISQHPNRADIVARISANHRCQYSDAWRKSQGKIAERADIVWGTYVCSKCQRSIKGKSNYLRYHEDMCGVPQKSVTCPHCGKVGSGGGMYAKHFDKCKERNAV